MTFIRKVKTTSGATAVQIAQKEHGRIVRIDHIGSAHSQDDLDTLLALAKKRLLGGQQSLFAESEPPKVYLKQSVSRLLLEVLIEQFNSLGFNRLEDDVFSLLCAARIVEPTSKLDSIRVLGDLGVKGLNKNRLYRCLGRIILKDYRATIASQCFAHAALGISLVLYDVTTLYFEVQKEDTYRKPGMSKERRLEPQIIVGLLVDQNGFPLGLHSFEGNTAETTTILPVIEAFKKQHNLTDITVVADAGMLSSKNLEALTSAGYTYIVGSRLHKIPYDIAEYKKTAELSDKQIITTELTAGQRIIYQYREKRAALDIRNIEKQISKAERIINGNIADKRSKFLNVKMKERKLNMALIDKAKMLAGIKGYVTNLAVPDEQVIASYHQLWHVEQSFRMSKSDLKARPIFHHKRDAIEAHLTVVFAALAIGKLIENSTGITIKRFVRTLRPIRSGTVLINGKEYEAEAEISTEVKSILRKLRSGH
ncbi:MAG TPA: IS1634 family transposase [Patescibacteria group bacterium]|nr:IS1634 family transposase [Patescibacteria group bacterium]